MDPWRDRPGISTALVAAPSICQDLRYGMLEARLVAVRVSRTRSIVAWWRLLDRLPPYRQHVPHSADPAVEIELCPILMVDKPR